MGNYSRFTPEIKDIIDSVEGNNLDNLKLYLNKNNSYLINKYLDIIIEYLSVEPDFYDILLYLLEIGLNPNSISDFSPIIFKYISAEINLSFDDTTIDLSDKNIRLLVKYGANINYVVNLYTIYKDHINNGVSNIVKPKNYINNMVKKTALDLAGIHYPAKNYLLSIGAKTAREIEKEEILSKENRNEYEELIYNCFMGNLEKVKSEIKPEYEKGFEGYIYSPIIASFESENKELMSFLLKYTIDIILSDEENKIKFQDKNLFKSYLERLFYESNLKYHEKIMEIYNLNSF